MPVGHGDAEVVLHALAEDEPVGVVDLVRQRIGRAEAAEGDPPRDLGEELAAHCCSSTARRRGAGWMRRPALSIAVRWPGWDRSTTTSTQRASAVLIGWRSPTSSTLAVVSRSMHDAADPQLEGPGLDGADEVATGERDPRRGHGEPDDGGLARLELHARIAEQLRHRPRDRGHGVVPVQLDDVGAGARPRVRDADARPRSDRRSAPSARRPAGRRGRRSCTTDRTRTGERAPGRGWTPTTGRRAADAGRSTAANRPSAGG